jgi:hypothetical protein
MKDFFTFIKNYENLKNRSGVVWKRKPYLSQLFPFKIKKFNSYFYLSLFDE